MRTTASFRCYFDTISENIKIISKMVNPKRNIHINFTVLMFYYKILWFYQDFKSKNLCFFKSVLTSRR